MRRPSGCEKVGVVTFRWQVLDDGGCVQVLWQDLLVVDHRLDEKLPRIPFELFADHEDGELLVRGTLVYYTGPVLRVEGLIIGKVAYGDVWLWPRMDAPCPPEPRPVPDPVPAPPAEPGEVIRPVAGQDLFPYLYLRPWPGIPADQREERFVAYTGPCAQGSTSAGDVAETALYCALLRIVETPQSSQASPAGGEPGADHDPAPPAPDPRQRLEQEAVRFVAGKPPYRGQPLDSLSQLPERVRGLLRLDRRIRRDSDLTLDGLRRLAVDLLGFPSWADLVAYVTSQTFQDVVLRVWQNVFALVVLLGYEFRLLDHLLRILAAADLLTDAAEVPLPVLPPPALPASADDGEAAAQEVASEDGLPDTGAAPGDGPGDGASNAGAGETVETAEVRRLAEADDDADGAWSPAAIQQRARATVLLPAPVFPLPPGPAPETPVPRPLSVVPYAIGELQMVRQRLIGYRLGEVSRIVNVLGGERRETAQRRLSRVETSEVSATTDSSASRAGETGVDLLAATQDVLRRRANVSYETQYGPPTATPKAVGSWTLAGKSDGQGDGGGTGWAMTQEAAARFARQITTEAVRRLAREVAVQRSTSTLDETEATTTSSFDATAGGNLRGIYRWVDKVYRTRAVRYGERLILEIFVQRPARRFIASQLELEGLQSVEPPTLRELGVDDFSAISADPESPLYYGTIAGTYQASDLTPPPAAQRTVSATLQPGTAVTTRELAIPEGYAAARAFAELQTGAAAAASPAASPSVQGIVGRQAFTLPSSAAPSDPAAGASSPIALAGETGALPLALVYQPEEPSWSIPAGDGDTVADAPADDAPADDAPADDAPADDAPADGPTGSDSEPVTVSFAPVPVSAEFVVNVEVECHPTEHSMSEWQIATYRVLLEASRRARQEYYRVSAGAPARGVARNPQAEQRTIRKELQRDVMRILLRQADRKIREPREQRLGKPRYQQFLERAFEWNEMAFTFIEVLDGIDGEPSGTVVADLPGDALDTPFSAFLQARSARVLLPVDPGFNFGVVFFLQTGMIWSGADELAPAFAANEEMLSLVNDLKDVSFEDREVESTAWEVTVPTAMTVLQEGAELPSFLDQDHPGCGVRRDAGDD